MKQILFLIAALIPHILSPCHAISARVPTVQEAVSVAKLAAIVEITEIKPARFEYAGRSYVCGNLYVADVIKTYKGNRRRITFFSPSSAFFEGFDRNYLLIAFGRNEALVHSQESGEFEAARKSCADKNARYFVHAGFQLVFPFEVRTDGQEEVEWLRVSREYPFGSVISNPEYEYMYVPDQDDGACGCGRDLFLWRDVEEDLSTETDNKR